MHENLITPVLVRPAVIDSENRVLWWLFPKFLESFTFYRETFMMYARNALVFSLLNAAKRKKSLLSLAMPHQLRDFIPVKLPLYIIISDNGRNT